MAERNEPLRFAIPSKGALADATLGQLRAAGLKVKRSSTRSYRGHLDLDPPVEVWFQRAPEIVVKLDQGELDAGITGRDLYEESRGRGSPTRLLIEGLGYGDARLVLAAPESWIDVRTLDDLRELAGAWRERGQTLRVATKFHNLTRAFLMENGVEPFELVDSQGATEMTPELGVADLIADLTSTGTTLREHNLAMVEGGTILRTEACLLVNRDTLSGARAKLRSLRQILELIEAHHRARRTREFVFTFPADNPEQWLLPLAAAVRPSTPPAWQPVAAPRRATPLHRGSFCCETRHPLKIVHQLRDLGARDVQVRAPEYAFAETSEYYERLRSLLKR
jgi:ATP phosphoribosyltransferase